MDLSQWIKPELLPITTVDLPDLLDCTTDLPECTLDCTTDVYTSKLDLPPISNFITSVHPKDYKIIINKCQTHQDKMKDLIKTCKLQQQKMDKLLQERRKMKNEITNIRRRLEASSHIFQQSQPEPIPPHIGIGTYKSTMDEYGSINKWLIINGKYNKYTKSQFEIKSDPSTNENHLKLKESEIPQIMICPICAHRFWKGVRKHSSPIPHIWTHMKIHVEKDNICPLCKKEFRLLRQHINTHFQYRKHVCKICNGSFSRKSDLIRHMRSAFQCDITGFFKKPTCQYCNKEFNRKDYKIIHETKVCKNRPLTTEPPIIKVRKIILPKPEVLPHEYLKKLLLSKATSD